MTTHDGHALAMAETSELLLRLAVENAALVAWSTDRGLRVTSFHAQTRCASGKPPEDRRGMTVSALFHADTPDSQSVAVHRRALEGQSDSFRFEWEGRPYRADVFPHKDKEGRVVGCLGFAQAIAEPKQTEATLELNESDVRQLTLLLQGMWRHIERRRVKQALKASRRELDAIFEHAPVVMILVNRDGRVKKANRLGRLAAKRLSDAMTDLRIGEALRCAHSLDVPEGCGFGPACKGCRVRALVLETVETGKVHQGVEVLLLMEFGGKPVERFVLVSAARVNPREKDLVLVCLEDITDRKQIENALKKHQDDLESLVETRTLELATSEARYRRLVERSPGILYVFSSRRGGIFYSNRVESVLGYSVDHLLENPFLWNHSIHPEDRPKVESAIQEAARNGVFDVEYRVEDARGKWLWLHDCSVAVRHEQDELLIEGLATDVTHRKRAEESLRESEERFRMMHEQSPLGYQSLDEQGRLLEVNAAWLDTLGYTREEVLGRWFGDFLAPEYRPVFKQRFECFKEAGETHGSQFQMVRKDGSRIVIEFDGKIGYDAEGNFQQTHCIMHDITERKRAEEALLLSKEKYQDIFDGSVAAVYVFDAEMNFIDSNQAGLELLGYSREKLLSMSVSDVDADPKVVLPAHEQLFSGEKLVNYEHQLKRKDGTVVTVLNNSKPLVDRDRSIIGVQSTLIDITERKRAEESLRESNEKLRLFAEQSMDGIWQLDSQGKILFTSAAADGILGHAPGKTLGMSFAEFFPESELPKVNRTFEKVLSGESYRFLEFDALGRDGSIISIEMSASPITKDGLIIGAQGIIRDISYRKQHQAALRESHKRLQETLDELRATREQVIQQERLLALGEMASGVGHDLNNSLSPVLGYSEILLEDARLPGDAREYLKWIRNGARDAAAVVARLREFYRSSSPDESRGPMELAELLEEVVQLTRPKWRDEAQRKGRDIEVAVRSEDAPFVLGNAAELREVLTNLVFNAVDAMPSGGRIALRLRGESEGAVVEVADTGVGMSDEVRAKCFEPFFTTKGHEGTGLGLSVCHGIVQRHGGRIEIDSSPGQGTTVRLFLPAAEEGPLVEEPEAEVSLPASRVLYIDDDPRLRSVIADMLQQFGQEVDLAEGGVRGLELLEANDYDLVITDWGMPGMDGYVVTGKIKALRPELPVAMLTGWGSSEASGSMESGEIPDYLLSKPPRLDEIRALLIKLMP